ncbi:hypothetical protein FKW77_000643 [Venturia effusa]|uniref:Uncharacterized protein n=1 Tax=Venturia effusa TaxID=50376 RepID=A0A517L4S7_9PEZI|nr:hypothetical protein FKW77_000643 [Venturia effusa]
MGLDYFASQPVLVLPPQHQHNYFAHELNVNMASAHNFATHDRPFVRRSSPPRFPPRPPSLNYLSRSHDGIAGRKRSRADIHEDDEPSPAGPVQPPKPKVEPVYGPGMTLMYPDEPALNIAAESQSGTWMEEKADTVVVEPPSTQRPVLTARKSQRRDLDGESSNSINRTLDPIVLKLGIGWKRVTETQAAAVAGQETYIKNQYPYVQQPKIVLQHEGLGIFVTRSAPIDCSGSIHQWWLFTEDLNTCRLLCNSTEEEVLRRLGNKRQDERGNWIPDILADGQIIHAKDTVASMVQANELIDGMEVDL